MTPAEARAWGRGVTRRIATAELPGEVLALVDERQGGRFCTACRGLELVTPADVPLEIDHLQPLSQGGDNHHMNLRWACRSHNRSRKDKRASAPLRRPRWERRRPS